MKKRLLALTAGFATSLGAFAALPTDAQPYQVVVPNLKSGIDMTLEGLYLRPSNSNVDDTTVNSLSGNTLGILFGGETPNSISNNVQTVDPDYNFGFRVALGYTFADSGNDVQLAWTHFNHTDSNTTNLHSPSGLSALTSSLGKVTFVNDSLTDFERGNLVFSDSPVYEEASSVSNVKFKLDSVDLNVGQFMDIGTRLRMRMFGGLRFAQVTNNQTSTTNATGTAEMFSISGPLIFDFSNTTVEQFNSKFSGVGPQLGIDSNYHIGNCFGVTGKLGVGLLIGNVDTNTSSSTTFTDGVEITDLSVIVNSATVNSNLNSDNVARVVPTLDAKLGFNWSYIFSDQSVLMLEGGYQWTQYINAVDKLTNDQSDIANSDPSIASSLNVTRTTSSVGFDGPYLMLNWKV